MGHLVSYIRRALVGAALLCGFCVLATPVAADAPFGYLSSLPNPALQSSGYGDFGGYALLQTGTSLLVGAKRVEDSGSTDVGIVYVFQQSGADSWTLQQTLTQPQARVGTSTGFGRVVVINNDELFISDPYVTVAGKPIGAVYVYSKDSNGQWVLQQEIDGPSTQTVGGSTLLYNFGVSLDIKDDQLVVGASSNYLQGAINAGAVYVYSRASSTGVWTLTQQLVASDAEPDGNFGGYVALGTNILVVGAPLYPEGQADAVGRAYIFERDTDTGQWQQLQELEDPNDHSLDAFGHPVLIIGGSILVGSSATINGVFARGAVYIYKLDSASGQFDLAQSLLADDGKEGDFFGLEIANCDPYLVVSAKYATTPDRGINFSGTGRVYVLKQNGASEWQQAEEIFDPVNVDFDLFGSSLSCSASDLVVGAGGITINGGKSEGAVYTAVLGGDLLLKQHAESESVVAGNNLTYDFTLTNRAAATATNVVLTAKLVKPPPPPQPVQPANATTSTSDDLTVQAPDDYLFGGVGFVSADGATCSAKNGIITCKVGDIAPGVTLQPSITVHFATTAAGNPLDIAIVRSDQENVVTPDTRAVSSVEVKAAAPPSQPPPSDKGSSGGGALGPLVLLFWLLVPLLRKR